MLSWFDAGESKKFGESQAKFFLASIPPGSQIGDKAFAQKTVKILGKMSEHIAWFKKEHKLNVYKKAQLGNSFRWTLIDAGVTSDYADELTKWLMQNVG